jgi:Cdc6-like AAA superfamily ATPase
LAGTDPPLQKFLGLESSAAGRRTSTRRYPQGENRHTSRRSTIPRRHSSTGDGPSRPTNVEAASRFDEVRRNSPKRTFSVNLQLLTLAIDGDEPEDLAAILDSLRSVFDLVDGQFYEIDGRRLRSKGYLPGSGRRHARTVLNRFTSRSMASGGRRISITNRGETRPDLVLNGNELANFIVMPPAFETPARAPSHDVADARGPDGESVDKPELEDTAADPDPGTGQSGKPRGKSLSSAPNSVMHRDAEIRQMTGVLEPLASGSLADTILVTGPTGSGKTHTVKYAVDRLCQQNPGLNAVYVNCWEDHSAFQTLYRILDHLEGTLDIHRKSTPRDVLLDRLKEHDDEPSVVILDEVDQLDDKDLLYDLINLPRFSLLLIVNQEENLLDGLDDRLASRLGGCERIPFGPYTVNQLVDILREIAKRESVTRNLDQGELELVADAVNGDARVAQTALRIAARRAEEQSEERFTQDIVESALPEARQEVRRKSIDMLSPHQQITFRVIEEHGKIAPGELIEEYRERVDDPKSNRTIRNYLNKLERYDLVAAEGTTRDRMYRCLSNR